MTDDNNMTFEDTFAQLEDIVARLESGDLSLEESVELFARGQQLARMCGVMLDEADLRIQQIDDDGEVTPLDD